MRARLRAADGEGQSINIAFGGALNVRDLVTLLGGEIREYLFEAGCALCRRRHLDGGQFNSFGTLAADHIRHLFAGLGIGRANGEVVERNRHAHGEGAFGRNGEMPPRWVSTDDSGPMHFELRLLRSCSNGRQHDQRQRKEQREESNDGRSHWYKPPETRAASEIVRTGQHQWNSSLRNPALA